LRKVLSFIAPLSLVAAGLGVGTANAAQGGNGSGNAYGIANNTPGFIKHATDLGSTDPSAQITVTVWLQLHNQAQLDQLVQQQYQKNSGQFHKWLNQSQFDASYSPTSQEVTAVSNFLQAKGLTVGTVADNNWSVDATGTVAQIQNAFKVNIHNFNSKGVTLYGNTSNPTINDPSGANVTAITGLDDVGYTPAVARAPEVGTPGSGMTPYTSSPHGVFFEGQCFRSSETDSFTSATVSSTYTGNRYGADITNQNLGHLPPCGYSPSELQTAYNLNSLYAAGLSGTGQTIVIIDAYGSSTIQQDANVFASINKLPALDSSNFQILGSNGTSTSCSPSGHGPCATNWDVETTLDVEWAHAMAPGAKIDLLIAGNNTSDLEEKLNYAVVHHLGNTISNSWSGPENSGSPARYDRVNRILEQAAAEGVDVNFATGDSGDNQAAFGSIVADFPGTSPYATAIGGTSLALNPDNSIKWQSGWGTNLTKLAGTVNSVHNTPFNPPDNSSADGFGFQGGAGGGPSMLFAKPSWQTVPGTMRQTPDVSMLADPFTGAEFIQTVGGQLSVGGIGGTSLATPMFSAVMAIAAQNAGHGLGQAAPLLYGASSGSGALTDVSNVTSPTNVTGSITANGSTTPYSADQLSSPLDGVTTYYSALYNSPFSTSWYNITFGTDSSLQAVPGWDDVTGLGTPNGVNFVNTIGQ
jgi:subtilase family serine protease